MSRKTPIKKQATSKPAGTKLLAAVPFENGFRFYTSVGNYTGITATSLSEFASKLQTVPAESVTFHFQRKDFQKWIKDTLKDARLSQKMSMISQGLSGEDLRKEILNTVRISVVTLA